MKKHLILFFVSLFLISILSTPVLAKDKGKMLNERQLLLNTPAYFTMESSNEEPSVNYTEETPNYYMGMSDEEFNNAIKKHLKDVAQQKNNGEQICWNKKFVQDIVKQKFPDIYDEINAQVVKQEKEYKKKISNNSESATDKLTVTASYTPDDAYHCFTVWGKSAAGVKLYSFNCTVEWSWDSTRLTHIGPVTWGKSFVPYISYKGINYARQGYVSGSNYTRYYIEREGLFYFGNQSYPYYLYPWMYIIVKAGGSYEFDWASM